jgi:hypothetical protein
MQINHAENIALQSSQILYTFELIRYGSFFKHDNSARVCISDKDRLLMFYLVLKVPDNSMYTRDLQNLDFLPY